MIDKNEMNSSLEQLLESLIRMVGHANQNVDSLQRRVSQLEYMLKEQHVYRRKEFILTKTAENQ